MLLLVTTAVLVYTVSTQNVNSHMGNVVVSGVGNNNVNTVIGDAGDNELNASQNGLYCTVHNGQIFVNGRYIRNMLPADYVSLAQYKEGVAMWSASLNDNIQRSFPWDPRNPHHNEFPWNPAAFPGRRRRATMPFPNLPDFCYN